MAEGLGALLAALLAGCVGGDSTAATGGGANGGAAADAAGADADLAPIVDASGDAGRAPPIDLVPDSGGGPPCGLPLDAVPFDDAGIDPADALYPFCNLPGSPCEEIWRVARCFCDDGRPGENFCDVGGTYSACHCD
jgi:hypothetical protein